MKNRIIEWLIETAKKKPYFHLDGYMHRYWLVRETRFGGIRIHHILRSDDDRAFHDHRGHFIAIILRGGYTEVTPNFNRGMYFGQSRKYYGAGSVLFRKATAWHRLEIEPGTTVWTMFLIGPRIQEWGFLLLPYKKIHWRDYLRVYEDAEQEAGEVHGCVESKDGRNS